MTNIKTEGHKFIDSCHRFEHDAAARHCAKRSSPNTHNILAAAKTATRNCVDISLSLTVVAHPPPPPHATPRHRNVHRRAQSPCKSERVRYADALQKSPPPVILLCAPYTTPDCLQPRPRPECECVRAYTCWNLSPELIVSDTCGGLTQSGAGRIRNTTLINTTPNNSQPASASAACKTLRWLSLNFVIVNKPQNVCRRRPAQPSPLWAARSNAHSFQLTRVLRARSRHRPPSSSGNNIRNRARPNRRPINRQLWQVVVGVGVVPCGPEPEQERTTCSPTHQPTRDDDRHKKNQHNSTHTHTHVFIFRRRR